MLLGRAAERARIDLILDSARAGEGGALLLLGEAGIGKTALLEHAAGNAGGMQLLRGVGIESEIELPFAFLHLLLHTHLDRIDRLPTAQANALHAAIGLAEQGSGDRFLLGLATLSMLSELADDGPVLCVVDDAQWVDHASADALLFAARRLGGLPVAVLLAARTDTVRYRSPGIDTVTLSSLDQPDAIALLDAHAHTIVGPTRSRILGEARGNPLAIIEFSAAVTERRGARWSAPVEPLPVAGRVQEAFRAQIEELPPATQRMLQVAAADDTASLAVVQAAGRRLGLSADDLEPAARDQLVELGPDTLTFRHPLVRAAAYRGGRHGSPAAAHRALAAAVDGDQHADRRAWHLAAATPGPDEAVAEQLERAAHRARFRGGAAATAAALHRAAELSTDRGRTGDRLVGAARAAYDAGWLDRAAQLSEDGASLTDDPSTRAEASWIRAQVAYELVSPAAAAELAVQGGRPIVTSHPEQAVSMLCDAAGCAKDAGRLDLLGEAAQLMDAVTLPAGSDLAPVRTAMIGLAAWLDRGAPTAVTAMRALVDAARGGSVTGLVERVLAGYLAVIAGDDDDGLTILDALVTDVRQRGALGWVPYAQEPLAITQLLHGQFRAAEATVTEALAVSSDLGQQTQSAILTAIPAWLASVAGDDTRCRSLTDTAARYGDHHPTNAALAGWATGLLDLARGRFDAAADRLETVCSGPSRRDFLIRAVPDHVEATVRSGRPTPDLQAFDLWVTHTGHDHAAGLLRRCRALLTNGSDAEGFYLDALLLHHRSGRTYDAARTALLFGEWLRRQRRRADARTHLVEAMRGFDGLGVGAWASRARAELTALGDRPVAQPHDHDLLARLSPQERQVVTFAAAGMSNRDIAARLFLSHRTVEHHLYRSYPKLGITGRRELGKFVNPTGL